MTVKKNNSIKWEALQLRVSAYPVDPLKNTNLNWWKIITDKDPDEINSRPALGMVTEIGEYNNTTLVSSITSNKIDLIQGISPKLQFESDVYPSLGKFPETLEALLTLIMKWLNLLETIPINRLALGIVLIFPVSNHEEGYVKLNQLLPEVNIDVKNSSDLFFQINRPRKSVSDIPDLIINRLSKWNVERRVLVEGSLPGKMVSSNETFACRLELDVNTMADYSDELSYEKLPEILEELINLGKEISEKGDIK